MPLFEVEQYELYVTKYRVEASSEAEAIDKLLQGQAAVVDNSSEFVEVADDFGMPADEYPALVAELRELPHGLDIDDIIPSIRSVCEVDE